jgi:hypothetical protein
MIHGYVVVRTPRRSFDEQQRLGIVEGPPCRGTRCYHGIDRMRWFDIDEGLLRDLKGTVPQPARPLRRIACYLILLRLLAERLDRQK